VLDTRSSIKDGSSEWRRLYGDEALRSGDGTGRDDEANRRAARHGLRRVLPALELHVTLGLSFELPRRLA
jgi:hypothetical protein